MASGPPRTRIPESDSVEWQLRKSSQKFHQTTGANGIANVRGAARRSNGSTAKTATKMDSLTTTAAKTVAAARILSRTCVAIFAKADVDGISACRPLSGAKPIRNKIAREVNWSGTHSMKRR